MSKHRRKYPQKSRSKKRVILTSVLSSFLIIFGLLFWNAGSYLAYNDSPAYSEAIIVLSGEGGRVQKAVKLYEQGFGEVLILSNSLENGNPPKKESMLEAALSLGIPKEVALSENAATSTYENAKFSLAIMQSTGRKSAIVVSSDYHMRRVKYLFDKVYKNSGISLIYVGSGTGYNSEKWWSNPESREKTIREYVKLIGNTLGYQGREAKQTFEQIINFVKRN